MQVQPSSRPGAYLVAGSTNLPEQSLIAVAATRSLRPGSTPDGVFQQNATYSILARQIVKVEQGNWQATLNLWQIAPNGQFQEAWQLNQSEMGVSVNPETEVTFVALVEPAIQSPALAQKLETLLANPSGELVRFTTDDQYIQATKTLLIPLPTGKTTPPVLGAEDENGGWGDRFLIKEEPPNAQPANLPPASETQTNAPLSSSEFLR
ncbi:MAG: hypothetical protein KME06_09840 [Kastovskya adunca ATA6-11-RM4]|jgi:hypothetical protein|nr:hypothetical protein [Kastovskya adunca ATA6-11-RM4]